MIDSDSAKKIRQANLSNLLKKLRSGKTLTSAELQLLEESEDYEKELVTLQRVLDIFGITRKTVSVWRSEGKDVPNKVGNKEDLAAWRRWFASNPDAGFGKNKPRRDRETLLCEKLQLEIEAKQLDLERERGEWLNKRVVEERDLRIAAAVKGALLKMTNDAPPMMEGLPAAKIQKVMKQQVTGILEQLADDQSEFWRNEPSV